jgi:glutathione S-transferase
MDIALYYAPNTCALVPYVALTEAKAAFEVRPLNFRQRQHLSPEYLKVNPKHKVPALVVDGRTLTENIAIQVWIARTFPEAKLLPADPWQEVKAISILSWSAAGMHPLLARINNPAKGCDFPGSETSIRALAQKELFESFRIADDMLAGHEFFFDHFTTADAHFFWCFRRATQFDLDVSEFRNCMAHFERMTARPSVRKVFAYEKDVQAAFAKVA